MDIKAALKVYKSFHLISRQPTWGDIPLSCDCSVCFAHCVCAHTLLFTSLFVPEICVPATWVAATISQRKKTKSIKGTAGRRRMRIIEERKDDEKHIDSKVRYLAGPSASLVVPTPVFPPDSSDDDFEVCACIPCLHVHSPTDHCAGRRPLKGGGSKRLQHQAHQSRRGHGSPAHPRLPPSHPGTRLPRVSPLQVHRNIVLLVVAAQALSRSLESRRRSRSMTLPPFSKLLMIHAMHHAQGCKRASKEKSSSQRHCQRASQRRGGKD